MKANKKKRLFIENNKNYKDENKKESINMKKRINKSFKKIKKQIKYKKRKWKEYVEETEDIKTFKEDDQDQAHYTINNEQPNDKSIDEPFPVFEEGTPYCSFVFSLIVGHYISFDKRKNNGPDDIINLYYKGPEFKKIKTSSTSKENNHKKMKIKGKIFAITKEKEDDIKHKIQT